MMREGMHEMKGKQAWLMITLSKWNEHACSIFFFYDDDENKQELRVNIIFYWLADKWESTASMTLFNVQLIILLDMRGEYLERDIGKEL